MDWFLNFIKKQFKKPWFFKFAFNISPMYRRSVARIIKVSQDLHYVKIKIPLNYKNKNYMGSTFGGSLFSATDPIAMIQLIQILGDDYVIWDKSASIRYKTLVRETVYANFEFSKIEIEYIKNYVAKNNEMDLTKVVTIENKSGKVFSEVTKVIYITKKQFFKDKQKARKKKLS